MTLSAGALIGFFVRWSFHFPETGDEGYTFLTVPVVYVVGVGTAWAWWWVRSGGLPTR